MSWNSGVFTNEKGRHLAFARHMLGLSQKQVGRMIGKSGTYVSGCELGKIEPCDLKVWAKALHTTVGFLEGKEAYIK